MSRLFLIIVLLCVMCLLGALQVPLSDTPVLTDDNMFTGFFRVDPDDKLPSKLDTRAWIWQDGDWLVVHFACEIDADFRTGAPSMRDYGTDADYVRVQLVTMPDAYYAYYYQAYPQGNLLDGVRQRDMNVDYSWNSGYKYETAINSDLWETTIRIPLRELRFRGKAPYNWKIILTRRNYKAEETFSSPYVNTNWGTRYFTEAHNITLTEAIQRSLDIRFMPYFVKSYDLMTRQSSFDPENLGLDISFNPGQRTRIKVTLNPDFSDIPRDSAQDIYNSIYPPYLDENRFFFTEDIDALALDSNAFYSRNIVQPTLAFKATGAGKNLNWGVLGARDKKITEGGWLINPDDYYQVLAVNPRSETVVFNNAVISRLNKGYYNHVYSTGLTWEMVKDLRLQTRFNGSVIGGEGIEPSDPRYGAAYGAGIGYYPGNLALSLGGNRVTYNYFADAGYSWVMDMKPYSPESWNTADMNLNGSWSTDQMKTYLKYFTGYAGYSTQVYYYDDTSTDSYSAYMGCSLTFRPKYTLGFNGNKSKVVGTGYRQYDVYSLQAVANIHSLDWLFLQVSATQGKQLINSLRAARGLQRVNVYASGSIYKKLRYSGNNSIVFYDYPRVSTVDYDGVPMTVRLDNRYGIFNWSMNYTANSKLRLSSGLSLSTYETSAYNAKMDFYANLRYEFRPDYFFYMGYATGQIRDEEPSDADLLGHYVKTAASLYAKVAIKI